MSTESISCQVVDGHRGSWRLPIQTRPVVLAHAGDHVEAGVVEVDVVHQPAVGVVRLGPDRPLRLRAAGARGSW